MLAFLAARATPGMEQVENGHYTRRITVDGKDGRIDVSSAPAEPALILDVEFPDSRALLSIVERVRRMFDLGADPILIGECLGSDRWLRAALAQHPGIRTPGAWDGFELAVRAILGQQVTVRAATTMAGRLAQRFGTTPGQLADADIESTGVVRARAHAIRTLARETLRGGISFAASADRSSTVAALGAIPGIGDWTAQYIAMRALGEPDAFPYGDLILRRMVGDCSASELERRSDAWRPWRAYAVMLLWQAASDAKRDISERKTHVHVDKQAGRGGRSDRSHRRPDLRRPEQDRRDQHHR
jgi:AraC family transcriptional regulator of adaptative response / DNA-3-methyladenine glycosylase II